MALLRREPREVYRVFGAEAFLAGEEELPTGAEHAGDRWTSGPAGVADVRAPATQPGERAGAMRTLSAALLVAGVGVACGLIVARNMPSVVHGLRRDAPRAGVARLRPGIRTAIPAPRGSAAEGAQVRRGPALARLAGSQGRSSARGQRRGSGNAVEVSAGARTAWDPRVAAGPSAGSPAEPSESLEFGFER
jgi:hypothetical protein